MKPRHALPRKPPHKPDPSTGGDIPGVGFGEDLGGGLTEAEVDYLMGHEWALNAEDILWRQSKLGSHFSDEDKVRLDDWIGRMNVVTERALGQ